jgi:ATP-dependent DNA helicase RecG
MAVKWRENGGKMAGKVAGKTSVKILELVKINPQITIPELATNVGISIRTIERNIQKLQKESILKRVGGANGGYCEVVE